VNFVISSDFRLHNETLYINLRLF